MGSDDRYDVFVSYARSDEAAAAELNGWLNAEGLRTFFDRSELRPGLRWISALEDAISHSNAVAILVGKHGIGNTQQYERELALVRQTGDAAFAVIPVLMPGCDSPPTGFLQLLTWVDLSKGTSVLKQPASLATLRAALRCEPTAPSDIRATICPYRGLEPFREEDAAFFCGRDEAISDLVARVQEHSFVVLVGPSGSGKSSLVFAGLLPALRKQSPTTIWDVVTLRPGASPLRAFAAAFGTAPENAGPAEIDAYLQKETAFYRAGDAETLARIIERRLDAALEMPDRLLIYIDQFEELYAMAPAAEDKERLWQHTSDAEKFIALLVAATSGPNPRARVVLTVRADFYNPLIRNPMISTLLPRQQVNIPPMRREDLRSAIETPAEKAELVFAPPQLVDRILQDVGLEEGRLPLLQFALKETWARRESNKLTAEAYTEVGGVAGAIETTAQGAYERLTPAQQGAARRLFLSLVTPGEGQEDTRARVLIPHDAQQRDIINLFANPKTRLLVTGFARLQGAGQAGSDLRPTVEIAHEALIQRWPTLRQWINDNRENLRTRAVILRFKAEWEENNQNGTFLLVPGVHLERGRALLGIPGEVAVDDIRDYVNRSIEKEDASRKQELRRSRRIAIVVSALLLLAVGVGVIAIYEEQAVTQALKTSQKNYQLALNQAAGNLHELEVYYHTGSVPTAVLRSLVEGSEATMTMLGLPEEGDSDEVIKARIKLLEVISIMELSIGNSKAMETALERNALADRLKERDPSNPEFRTIWAMAHGHSATIQFKQCDSASAAQEAHISAEAMAKLLEDKSAVTMLLRDKHYAENEITLMHKDLQSDYETEGDALKALGDIEGADKTYHNWLRDDKRDLERYPNEPFWRLNLAYIKERIGDVQILRGDFRQALQFYKEDFGIADSLVKADPQKSEYLSALTQSQQRLGDAWLAIGDREQAMSWYQKYLDNAISLTDRDPENFRFRDFYITAYQRIGELYLIEGNIDLAIDNFNKYRETAEKMLRDHPSNPIALYDVSNSHVKIADAMMGKGDIKGAESEYTTAKKFATELNEKQINGKSCSNGSWQKLLAIVFQRLATVSKMEGRSMETFQNFQKCASISVNANAWAPATLWPNDPVAFCDQEKQKLEATSAYR
jgi:tetratricopeptide (TPR) repeat protein/energy-coupling factor transporter ATP-binding protein EcfA2